MFFLIVGIVLPASCIYGGYLYMVDARNYTIFLAGTRHTFFQCNVNAIRAAFLPEAVKERLESELREAYEGT